MSLVRYVRNRARDLCLELFHRVVDHDEGRGFVAASLKGILPGRPRSLDVVKNDESPYDDVGRWTPHCGKWRQEDVVIVTARFRSGSTLLWNLFRHVPGVTAYYEPFNNRRWFDEALRGGRVDPTHRGVQDYWREYDGLPREIGELYDEEWIRRRLYMDGTQWEPRMRAYIDCLVDNAPGRPVLQFNRVDFRLGWLRSQYPRAKFVHIFRHPRDQWCSTLLGSNAFGPTSGGMREFQKHDRFYLTTWVRDLGLVFPFLQHDSPNHPYRQHYYLWKLSWLFGRAYSDVSVRFEDLVTRPRQSVEDMLGKLNLERCVAEQLVAHVEKPELGRWREYADASWFEVHEAECERVLADYFSTVGQRALNRHGFGSLNESR